MRRDLGTEGCRRNSAGPHAHASEGPYGIEPAEVGRRSLRNLCLAYLMTLDDRDTLEGLPASSFGPADNMTDVIGGPRLPGQPRGARAVGRPWRPSTAGGSTTRWWSTSGSPCRRPPAFPGTLDEVKRLTAHPAFNIKNPNRVRSLIGAFAQGNPVRFHDAGGDGYRFLADRVLELEPPQPPGGGAPGPAAQPLAPVRRGPAAN